MSVNLTTQYLFKLYAGISVATHDTLIDRLISDVCELIAKSCNRTFESTTYKQWLDGNGETQMALPQWPITRIYKITSDTEVVMDIKFTGDGSHADVTVDATNVSLHTISAAGAEASNDLPIGTSKIISTLSAAIELISGWTTTVYSGTSSLATLFLKPIYGEDALSPTTASLEVPDSSYSVRRVEGTNRMIEQINSYQFLLGRSNVFCWFTAGYTLPVDNAGHTALTTEGNVPGGLTSTANAIINDVFKGRKKDSAMQSEHLGDYSYSRADVQSAIEQHKKDLALYSKLGI